MCGDLHAIPVQNTQYAVELLRSGELVAFPTETVYGLGADATNSAAVQKIFAAKGRPSNNPLIVHVADIATARRYAAKWDERAAKLAEKFWPGPLTLVVQKSPVIVDDVTAGLGTVGLRVPNHPVALELLRAFGGAVAAPSANRSNRTSPTTAEHVRQEFGNAIQLVLDGGPCTVGIESTVLDLAGSPRILRPGGVSREMIEAVLGEPVLEEIIIGSLAQSANSPGQLPVHYAPKAPAYRFDPSQWKELQTRVGNRSDVAVLLIEGRTPQNYARDLYARLRHADRTAKVILIEMPPDTPQWIAVRDRLLRATQPLDLSDIQF